MQAHAVSQSKMMYVEISHSWAAGFRAELPEHLSATRSGRSLRAHLAGTVTEGSWMTRYSTTATVTQNTANDQAFMSPRQSCAAAGPAA